MGVAGPGDGMRGGLVRGRLSRWPRSGAVQDSERERERRLRRSAAGELGWASWGNRGWLEAWVGVEAWMGVDGSDEPPEPVEREGERERVGFYPGIGFTLGLKAGTLS